LNAAVPPHEIIKLRAVSRPPPSLPLVVLTGFLGSGKTTLLNRLLSDPAMRDTAVIVNEFGDIGVDHLLVSSVADDVILLASGCVCCSAGDDLGTAVTSLLARRADGTLPPFQRIILETTGIAEPESVLQRLLSDGSVAGQIRIQSVVTVVDAVFGRSTLSRFTECAGQVAMANRLVISKLDLIGTDHVESLLETLRSINPLAPIALSARHDSAPAHLLGESDQGVDFKAIPPRSHCAARDGAAAVHSDRFDTFAFCWNEATSWNEFKEWLDGLLIARGDSILRMKGLLQVVGVTYPIIIQGVQHALYPPESLSRWPHGTPRSEMVFVTRDFSRDAALRSFCQFFPYRVTIA
jgi:G3E family GTPase